jgi:hypothetical protein
MKFANVFAGLAAATALSAVHAASAATIVLNFDGLNGSVNEGPLNYYNGGFGSAGTGPGPNYGVVFSSNSITGIEAGQPGANTNTAEAPSAPNILFFLTGGADTIDVAAGFTTGFSFYYSAVNQPGVINVYSGLDETGTLLASLNLPTTLNNGGGDPNCLGTNFCPFVPIGVTFAGTAMSVDFGGTANQIAFDNITFGSATAGGGVPEPASWALMLLGVGGLGATLRGSRRKAVAAI